MADSLLIIEDEKLLGSELARHYRKQGWEVRVAETIADARRELVGRGLDPLVVLSDKNLPDGNALDLLEEVRTLAGAGEWIFLTGYGGVAESVRALRLGAFDFLEKPCDLERLDVVVAGAGRSARAQRQVRDQAAAGSRKYSTDAFVGRSSAAQGVRDLLSKLVEVPFSALVISGETGTGKGLVARILHHWGTRRDGPLMEVNCAALPKDLLESELFGHEAGAFTGAKGRHRGFLEQAHKGTLFLDEIGELDLDLQAKLLKAIEEHSFRRVGGERDLQVDVQVIAASNRDLEERVRAGEFRSDLYHRLSVFKLALPSLRERREDLEDLLPAMVAEYNAKSGKNVKVVPPAIYERMRAYDWPGNVRELRNVVERGVLFSDSEEFPSQWLQLGSGLGREHSGPEVDGDRLIIPLDGTMALDEMDRYIIQTALERHGANVTATARALGTTRETLRYRIQKYGLKPETQEQEAAAPPPEAAAGLG